MKPEAIRYFVCPDCHGELSIESSESVEIETGTLICGGCRAQYPIRDGVPRFVGAESYADTFGRQWTRWSRTQHDSLNGTTVFHSRFQRYTGWTLDSLAGRVVIDAGCGPGGFIDVIVEHAGVVVGFDLSVAVDVSYKIHGARPNVHLAHGDILKPPIRPSVADRLYTFGVVQHTPHPEDAFRSLIPLVKPGGEIAVWVYRKRVIPQAAYWLRKLTAGMDEPRATQFIEWYVPKAMQVSGALGGVPAVGRYLRRLVPVADYRERLPELDTEQQLEWALMDTHDMLITRFTFPQRWPDLQRWMRGLEEVRKPHEREMSGVGRIPL
jgi:uncharacterized protein YbaR (Trm112 family)/ubiquinone/menaquinone biosynthesis C-methylase UbiE